MIYNGKEVFEAVDYSIKKQTTEVYYWNVNPGNGDLQIEVRTFPTERIEIRHGGPLYDGSKVIKLETAKFYFYLPLDDHNTSFEFAVVVDYEENKQYYG